MTPPLHIKGVEYPPQIIALALLHLATKFLPGYKLDVRILYFLLVGGTRECILSVSQSLSAVC